MDIASILDILIKLGFKEEVNLYSKLRDKYISKTHFIPREDINKFREKIKPYFSDYEKLLKIPSYIQLYTKFLILGLKLRFIIGEYKLLQELKQKDIPGDVFFWHKQYHSILKEYFEITRKIEAIDATIARNFDKNMIEKRILELKAQGLTQEEEKILLTPLKPYASLKIIYDYVKGKDISKHFFGSKILEKEFLQKNNELYYEKQKLARKYGDIVWEIEALLQFDNLFAHSAGRIAYVEIEHLPIRQKLFEYIFNRKGNLEELFIKIPELLDHKKTFSDYYLQQPVPISYPQKVWCTAAAPLNAISVWVSSLRKKTLGDLIKEEAEIYLNSSVYKVTGKPYMDVLIDFGIKYLKDKYGLEVIKVWEVDPEYKEILSDKFWNDREKVKQMLLRYGLSPRKITKYHGCKVSRSVSLPSWIRTSLSEEFIDAFIEFNKKALEIQKEFKHIHSPITAKVIEKLLDEGYSIALHHPIKGSIQHVVVVYGYNKKDKKILMFDQLGKRYYSVPYENITEFSKMPAGWTLWGFKKNINTMDYIKETIELSKELIDFLYSYI